MHLGGWSTAGRGDTASSCLIGLFVSGLPVEGPKAPADLSPQKGATGSRSASPAHHESIIGSSHPVYVAWQCCHQAVCRPLALRACGKGGWQSSPLPLCWNADGSFYPCSKFQMLPLACDKSQRSGRCQARLSLLNRSDCTSPRPKSRTSGMKSFLHRCVSIPALSGELGCFLTSETSWDVSHAPQSFVPSPDASKTRLDRVWSNLEQWEVSQPMAWGWNFKVPSPTILRTSGWRRGDSEQCASREILEWGY